MNLDVNSLFTKVPLHNVFAFLPRKLPTKDARLPLPTGVFLQLIHLCVESNFSSFEGCFYSQELGVGRISSSQSFYLLSPIVLRFG